MSYKLNCYQLNLLFPAPAVYIPPSGLVGNLLLGAEPSLLVAVKAFLRTDEAGAQFPEYPMIIDPVGVEGDGRGGPGDRGGEDQASSWSQNPDHLGKGFPVGVEVELVSVPSQAKVLRGAEGKDKVEGVIGQGQTLGIAGDDGFILHRRFSGADVEGGDGGMGQQAQDKMPIGPDIQDLPGGDAPDVKSREGAFIFDEILGMVSILEDGLLKNLKTAGVPV
jgi:hypothetical protein